MRITRDAEYDPTKPDDPFAGGFDSRVVTERARRDDTFDPLVDVFLPAALFVMLAALVWFLIDIRAALVDGPTRLLRWVFFFFILAVVGIARIRVREGGLSASVYSVGLLGAMGLFGYFFAYGGGSLGGGYGGGNPAVALLMNGLIIAFIWWAGNFVTQQTTIDPDSVEVQQSGLLSSEEWAERGDQSRAVRRRPHPGRAVMVLSACAAVIFGLGHKAVEGHPEFESHAFICLRVFFIAALLVLSMSALSGLDVYARMRGTRLPFGVAGLWLMLAFPLTAAIVAFAQVAPRLEPREGSWAPKLPEFLDRRMTQLDDAPVEGLRESDQSSAGHGGEGEQGSDSATGPRAEGAGEGQRSGGDQPGAGEGPGQAEGGPSPDGTSGQGEQGSGGEGGGEESRDADRAEGSQDGPSQAEGEGAQSADESPPSASEQPGDEPSESEQPAEQPPSEQAPAEQPTPPEPPPAADPTNLLEGLVKLAGLAVAAALAFLIVRAIARALRGRKLPLPAWFRRPPKAPSAPTRDPFIDPFGPRSPLRGQPPVEVVRHVYRAFQAYCAMIGHPRRPDLTAHEFLHELPPSMDSWRTESRALADLYAAAEYTPASVGPEALDELRPVWERLMRAVREHRGP